MTRRAALDLLQASLDLLILRTLQAEPLHWEWPFAAINRVLRMA